MEAKEATPQSGEGYIKEPDKKEIRKLIEKGNIEKLKELLRKNIIHVRDIKEIVREIQDEDFGEFYAGRKGIEELDVGLNALYRVLQEIESEFHDFSDFEKTITLSRDKHIYNKGENIEEVENNKMEER